MTSGVLSPCWGRPIASPVHWPVPIGLQSEESHDGCTDLSSCVHSAFSHAALRVSSPRRLHTNSAVYTSPSPPLLVIATPVPGRHSTSRPTPASEEKKKTRQTVMSVFIRDGGKLGFTESLPVRY
ncbi:hypothetical protein BJV78DRAFT_1233863 [Lactifluus subvellereus]|nr:hypothetical protein BJV78DRAFT_1233863 [Lactifluus subvellereus]